MPLAKESGCVSRFLQKFGEGLLAAIEALVEVCDSIAMRVFPGQGCRPGRGRRSWE